MDKIEKKQNLVKEFNELAQKINELTQRQLEIRGAINLLEELEKEEKIKTK